MSLRQWIARLFQPQIEDTPAAPTPADTHATATGQSSVAVGGNVSASTVASGENIRLAQPGGTYVEHQYVGQPPQDLEALRTLHPLNPYHPQIS